MIRRILSAIGVVGLALWLLGADEACDIALDEILEEADDQLQ